MTRPPTNRLLNSLNPALMHAFCVMLQVRSLRAKLKNSRATSEALNSELSALKISLHEKVAEMDSLCRRSVERFSPAGGQALQALLSKTPSSSFFRPYGARCCYALNG